MSESAILKTTETILNRIELEDQLKIKNKAIGHAVLEMDNVDKPFWLMRFVADANHRIIKDFVGNPVIVEPIPDQQLRIGGQNVFRDSKLGAFIIQHNLGTHDYIPNNTKSFKTVIKLKSYYNPSIYDGEPDGTEGTIEELDSTSYKFASLRSLIRELKELTIAKERLEAEIELQKEFSDKVTQLKEELSATEAAIIEKQMALKRHMSYEIQLRERAILDRFQDAIRRSKVLNGTLIINGGPGTGKTTMLIQRITYLTTPTIQEVFELTEEDKNILFSADKSWIFFSPSELLRSYLDYAMRKEGLNSDKDKVTTWELFKQRAAREYGLINSETRRPFIYQKSKTFYKTNTDSTKELLTKFDSFFARFQVNKCQKSFEVNTSSFQWHSLAVKMKAALKDMLSLKETKQFIGAYFNLNENFYPDTQIQRTNYFKVLNEMANSVQIKIENTKDVLSWFNADFQDSKIKANEDDDELEEELDDDVFEDEGLNIDDFRLKLSRLLKRILRKVALSEVDENTRLTKLDKHYYEQIERFIQKDHLRPLSEGAFFLKYFEKISRGMEINLIREFPVVYKLYRREKFDEIKSYLTEEGIRILEENINAKREKNRKATTHEFDFFFYWINNLVKGIYKTNKILFDNSKDRYIEGFKNLYKGVVAIDEATDFSPLELLAMSSFSYPKFNSVTLSGDLMQRMTSSGLKSWEDFTSLTDNVEIGSLKIAYRQTPTLLKLASLIYEQNTGIKAGFQSYANESDNYPSPLYYCDEDEGKRIQWIADRIVEINTVYANSIPTIAIFAKDDIEVSKVAHLLNNNQSIIELFLSAVPCVGGQILGDRQNIRVFPIEHIKGLEFESVFFWDIDTIETEQEDLVNKYIYVGLSRATFYLGITCRNTFPEKLSIIKSHINTDSTWL